MPNPTKPTTNLTREELEDQLVAMLIDKLHINHPDGVIVESKDIYAAIHHHGTPLIETYTQAKEREAHKDGYMQGVADFSGYYMDASIPAQRNLIMPHVAIELTENYKPAIYRAEKDNL